MLHIITVDNNVYCFCSDEIVIPAENKVFQVSSD